MPTRQELSEQAEQLSDDTLIDRLRSKGLTELAEEVTRQELANRGIDVERSILEPPQTDASAVRDALAREASRPSWRGRPAGVWAVSLYSVIWALLSYASLAHLFSSNPFGSTLPIHQRIYVFALPGLHLYAGVALFFLRKEAFPLYAAYFACLIALPVVASAIYIDPGLTANWLDVYLRLAKGVMGAGWLAAFGTAAYSAYLYRSGVLR